MEKDGGGGRKQRIYIGGLGMNVTEDEIRKTFSGLGAVESADIFRTKGRSFAYIDFVPANPKSLDKLFSSYNGCLWKGGRLRLEKAKEHYLVRMKREWAEDSLLTQSAPVIQDTGAPESVPLGMSKKLLTDERNLRIFFPKLNKMKSVPYGGSGKHKYSFQRINVPNLLPIHFCDCEEHCDSSQMARETPSNLGTVNGGIGEKELDIMESVMNKLFKRETHHKEVGTEATLTEKQESSIDHVDMPIGQSVSGSLSDEDDLIINMVAIENETKPLLRNRGVPAIKVNQEPAYGGSKTAKDWPPRKLNENQRKKIEPYNKKRKASLDEVCHGDGLGSFGTEKKKTSLVTLNELEDKATESCTQNSISNFSWSQKSSWKDLVGKRGADTPFQISHIVPSIPSAKIELNPDGVSVPNYPSIEHQNSIKSGKPESEVGQSKAIQVDEPNDFQSNESKDIQGDKSEEDLPGAESSALQNDDYIRSARGVSWKQKSSWTQLVGDTNQISFSISQVVPGLTFEKQALQQTNGTDAANTRDKIEKKEEGYCSKDSKPTDKYLNTGLSTADANALSNSPLCPDIGQSTIEEKHIEEKNKVSIASPLENRQTKRPKQIPGPEFGETCSFMRNADSLKEWANAKAAVSGSLKKKSKGKEV